jgi:hypothetical protein
MQRRPFLPKNGSNRKTDKQKKSKEIQAAGMAARTLALISGSA